MTLTTQSLQYLIFLVVNKLSNQIVEKQRQLLLFKIIKLT